MEPDIPSVRIDPATNQTRYTLNPLKPAPSQRHRIKTEPSEYSITTSMNHEGAKRGNKFTE